MKLRDYEPAYAALFAKLKALEGGAFRNVSRRLQHVHEYDLSNMPAAFQNQTGSRVSNSKTGLPLNVLTADWYLYIPAGSDEAATSLNDYIKLTAACIATPAGVNQTLGGTVEDCYIEGNIEMYEGVLHDRAVAIMPVVIVAPGF